MSPIPNGRDGRDGRGRFALGNASGPGNPNARTAHMWRERLSGIVTDADFDAIIRRMLDDAIAGDKDARAQLLDRLCGKPSSPQNEPEPEEHKLIFIRRLMLAKPPPGTIPQSEEEYAADLNAG